MLAAEWRATVDVCDVCKLRQGNILRVVRWARRERCGVARGGAQTPSLKCRGRKCIANDGLASIVDNRGNIKGAGWKKSQPICSKFSSDQLYPDTDSKSELTTSGHTGKQGQEAERGFCLKSYASCRCSSTVLWKENTDPPSP